jgi:hypothetical protein
MKLLFFWFSMEPGIVFYKFFFCYLSLEPHLPLNYKYQRYVQRIRNIIL